MVTAYNGCFHLALNMSTMRWVLETSVVGRHMTGRVVGIGGEFEVFGWLVGGW